MSPTRFIVVRHGETEWNLVSREMGQLDSPLTERGIEQARRVGDRLASMNVDHLYTSDLGRAMDTARIIADRCALRLRVDQRLRERHTGIFQGLTKAERRERYAAEDDALGTIGVDYIIPGGESARQRRERAVVCLEELAERHAGKSVLLVTHWGILMALMEFVLGLPYPSNQRFKLLNCAINVLLRDRNGWSVETWGDIAHLGTDIEPRPQQAPPVPT